MHVCVSCCGPILGLQVGVKVAVDEFWFSSKKARSRPHRADLFYFVATRGMFFFCDLTAMAERVKEKAEST